MGAGMNVFIDIGGLEDIPRLGARVVNAGARKIAVFRTADDQYFALDDRCPHRGGPLSQGIVHGTRVTCPLHNFVIALDSGEAAPPDTGCVARHTIKIEEGRLRLEIDQIHRACS
jgi:nitrite reductase (NADH) small subunit